MKRNERRRLIAKLENELVTANNDDEERAAEEADDRQREESWQRTRTNAAKTISEEIVKAKKAMTLKQIKEKWFPRSSWGFFSEFMLNGHRQGVLMMSRSDLTQLPGRKPVDMGEITTPNGAVFNYVKPTAQPTWKGGFDYEDFSR